MFFTSLQQNVISNLHNKYNTVCILKQMTSGIITLLTGEIGLQSEGNTTWYKLQTRCDVSYKLTSQQAY